MATVAIGDIHGNLPALADLIAQLQGGIGAGDTVVFLGDYIDRGPDSRACIDAILDFRDKSRAKVVCLQGNHEDWLLRTQANYSKHSWLIGMEALDTIRSYSPEAEHILREAISGAGAKLFEGECALPYEAFFDALPASHREFFAQLTLCVETEDCICSHAGVDPDLTSLGDQPPRSLIWGHRSFPGKYTGASPIVYGHWNNAVLDDDGWPAPRIVGNTIGIDTISHGVLTAIRMPDRRIFQSARHSLSNGGVQ